MQSTLPEQSLTSSTIHLKILCAFLHCCLKTGITKAALQFLKARYLVWYIKGIIKY